MGVRTACAALGLSRAPWYRGRRPRLVVAAQPRVRPARALSAAERQAVLGLLHREWFVDGAPATVYAALLDAGVDLASARTRYRLLAAAGELHERRNQRRHPAYAKPQRLATGPNQRWSWDITKLRGPAKWTSYHRSVILDVCSRYVVGWLVAARASAALAERLIGASLHPQGVTPGTLTLHADRGSSMRSQPVALLLADLGVAKTHTRPYPASDTPYAEAQCKTLKYRPGCPRRCGSLEDARAFCQAFFRWYTHAHRQAGIGLMTDKRKKHSRSPRTVRQSHAAVRTDLCAPQSRR